MSRHRQYLIKAVDSGETYGYRGPVASMTEQERQWIKQVLNDGKKKVAMPIETPIKCPAEYESYYDSTINGQVKRLSRQKVFLLPKLEGLAHAILQLSNKEMDIPKELLQAHSNYLQAVRDVEDQLNVAIATCIPSFRVSKEAENA